MAYKILHDYGTYEGCKFYDEKDFETVGEAVKFAIELRYGVRFFIVKVIDWQAEEKPAFHP